MSIETAFARVAVGGGSFHACTESQVVEAVREALAGGVGGRIITPNVDILRRARRDPEVRAYLADASFVVADGMPVVWASRLAGTPLPERVCGSNLIWSLAAGLGRDGRSVYVLGGEPAHEPDGSGGGGCSTADLGGLALGSGARDGRTGGAGTPGAGGGSRDGEPAGMGTGGARGGSRGGTAYAAGWADAAAALGGGASTSHAATAFGRPVGVSGGMAPGDAAHAATIVAGPAEAGGARRAAERLLEASPGLRLAGCHSPRYGFERQPGALDAVCRAVVRSQPDLVYVGLGFPKQEWLISRLRAGLPATWFLGCGAAVNFVAGDNSRAPSWMQRTGMEWAHRLASEPRRLAGRYLRHDAPYAARLLAGACLRRWHRR